MIKTHGVGVLIEDPTLERTEWGTKIVKFYVTTEEFIKKGKGKVKKNHMFELQAYDSGAETIVEQARKGNTIIFEAQPRNENNQVIFRLKEFKIV